MTEVIDIKGVGPVLAKAFSEQGYSSVKDIAAAVPSDLAGVRGVSMSGAERLAGAARALLCETSPNSASISANAQSVSEAKKKVVSTNGDSRQKGKSSKKNKKDTKAKKKNKKPARDKKAEKKKGNKNKKSKKSKKN